MRIHPRSQAVGEFCAWINFSQVMLYLLYEAAHQALEPLVLDVVFEESARLVQALR